MLRFGRGFLQQWGYRLAEVWYDVHVGKAVGVGVEGGPMLERIAAGLTRKRIDVVARVGGGYWVIEVKPLLGYVALGQVLTYFRLFVEEYRPDGEVWPVVICASVDDDVLGELDELGVVGITV